MTELYFAYGANLNHAGMQYRCPAAVPWREFELADWQLEFSGVATVRPCAGSLVPGALWILTPECEASLDVFEGYPDLYRKEYVEQDGLRFMIYVMNYDPPQPPGQGYFDTIARGYLDWNLPLALLEQAVERSRKLDFSKTAA